VVTLWFDATGGTDGKRPVLTAATCNGATTTLLVSGPMLIGCSVGTGNCHCWASISVSVPGVAALSVSLVTK